MTLQQFHDGIHKLLAEKPEAAEYLVIYAKDEEGNEYDEIFYPFGVGCYDMDTGDFATSGPENAVCVN